MASKWGGLSADLAGDSEEKKVSGRKKEKSSTGILQRVKAKWKSEDAVEDNEKKLMHDDDDASVVETVLKENSELQKKNTRLFKKLCDYEKTIKSYASQLQKKEEEIKRLNKLTDKPRMAPVKVQASHQSLAEEKVVLKNEVSRLKLQSSKLRESLDQVTHGNSGYEAKIDEIREQAEQVEVKYQVEREEKERLNSEVNHLQQQFKSLLAVHVDEKAEAHSSDDKIQSNAIIGRLQGRIKQLNEDLTSLREHSKTQSRQIIVLRQKAELTEHLEEQVASMDSLLIETEGERDDLRRKLIHLSATDDESNYKTVQLDPQDADVVELKRESAQLTGYKAQIEQAQASQVDDVRALNSELKIQVREKQELTNQVEVLQLQVAMYKADFEEERRDRAAAHGKMADMEKEMFRLEGRIRHEKAELEFERGELTKSNDTYKEVLQQKVEELEFATKELVKHKQILHDLETVHSRYVQEMQELKRQVSQAKTELQAEVKQYAKENKKLKLQVKEGLKVKEGNKVYQDEINSLSKQIEQIQIQRQEVEQRLHLQLRDKDDQIQNLTKALETANSQVPVNLKLKEENDAFQQEKIEKEIIRAQLQMELEHSQAEKRRIEERLIDKDHQIKELETKVEAANDKVKTRFTQLHSVQSDNSWNFQREEVVIKEEIGRGASGLVSKGQFCGQTIAVKQIHRNILTQKHVMDEFKREVRIMASVQHPNLVRFVGAVFDQSVENFTDTPLLLLELLHTNLRQGYERFDISPGVSVSIFRDVAYGLHYLHEHQEPIIHRDVSAPNVLLEALPGGMWRAKLSDFGSANFLKRSLTLGTGAIVYTAPEMFPREDPSAPVPCPTTKCDVFSYGIVLVEVITKTMPSLENRHELFAQVQRKWQMMYDLISQCTQRQPLNRPTMLTVLNTLNMIPVARPR